MEQSDFTIQQRDNDLFYLNIVNFMSFLIENNVVQVAVATVISERVVELINTIIDGVIMPILNRDMDGDGVSDFKSFEEKEIHFFGMTFKVGKVITSIIKFIIVMYVMFLLSESMKRVIG